MPTHPETSFRLRPSSPLASALLTLLLTGCVTVGPDYQSPPPQAPERWSAWHSGSSIVAGGAENTQPVPAQWWTLFADPTLEKLQARALQASPDLRTAALRFAQSREQRQTVAAQRGPFVDLNGGISRQRQSEAGAGSRNIPDNGDMLKALGEPYTLYQAGFDMSWELDLWGRIRRSIEAADADVRTAAALLESARLSVGSEVARNYFELQATRQQLAVLREDLGATENSLKLIQARAAGGLTNELDVVQQRTVLEELRARLPQLQEQETRLLNQLGLLLGLLPGELQNTLPELATTESAATSATSLPDLALGLPSQVARRRPDILAAEARLHAATASIGVAVADLYPNITLGASFGYESVRESKFGDWGSRRWSIGPNLTLPLFDQGRRRATINLRELQQQEAAVAYQQTVLTAWQEIDDALTAYDAEGRRNRELRDREHSSRQAYELAQARYRGGLTDFLVELDAQRTYLQARRDLVDSDGQLRTRLVAIYKAIGGGDFPASAQRL